MFRVWRTFLKLKVSPSSDKWKGVGGWGGGALGVRSVRFCLLFLSIIQKFNILSSHPLLVFCVPLRSYKGQKYDCGFPYVIVEERLLYLLMRQAHCGSYYSISNYSSSPQTDPTKPKVFCLNIFTECLFLAELLKMCRV